MSKQIVMNKPQIGQRIDSAQLFGLFPALEGTIGMIYGRIRNGKTTEGVSRIWDALLKGRVVYSNIPLALDSIDFDERNSFVGIIAGLLLPWKRKYYRFDKANFHYVDVDQFDGTSDLVAYLSTLTDCLIVWDEGWYLFDSYEGTSFSKSKRKLILHTGHFNREIIVISQRPTAIQASARGNVQIFWKCSKKMTWPFLILKVEEIQDMIGEIPDETKIVSTRVYFPSKKLHSIFDTHFLRKGIPSSQNIMFEAYLLSYKDKLIQFFRIIFYRIRAIWLVLQSKFPLKRKLALARVNSGRTIRKVPIQSVGVKVEYPTIKKGDQGGPNSSSSEADKVPF